MQNETSISIAAPPERVWQVMLDVERWPEWTPSISRIRRIDEGELRPGFRASIKQPGVPAIMWKVTSLEPGRSFEWRAVAPGMRSTAGHLIESQDGGSRVTLWVEQTGLLTRFVGGRIARMTRNYLQMEAEGLKRRCEGT